MNIVLCSNVRFLLYANINKEIAFCNLTNINIFVFLYFWPVFIKFCVLYFIIALSIQKPDDGPSHQPMLAHSV